MKTNLSPAEQNTLNMADAVFGALSKPRQSPADDDGGRTRIGNTPTCDECGEQHSQDDDCPEATHVEMPALIPRTQHQMRNIGNGNDPDAPLRYVAQLKGKAEIHTNTIGHDIDLICGLKAKLDATSEQEARDILEAAWPYFNIESLELL